MNVSTGGWIVIGSIFAVALASFLPVAESSNFVRVVDNTLIQHGIGIVILALLAVVGVLLYRFEDGWRRGPAAWIAAVGLLMLVILLASSNELTAIESTMDTSNMNVMDALEVMSRSEQASWGIGLILAVLGSLGIIVGGVVCWRSRTTDLKAIDAEEKSEPIDV